MIIVSYVNALLSTSAAHSLSGFSHAYELTLFATDVFSRKTSSTSIGKSLVRRRLAAITIAKPDANPSRSTLQSVHSFLMPRLD